MNNYALTNPQLRMYQGEESVKGSIAGKVFFDEDKDGSATDDRGLRSLVVWIDLNGSGDLDDQDRSTFTDVYGNYLLPDLDPGTYLVQVNLPDEYAPLDEASRTVTVGAGQQANAPAIPVIDQVSAVTWNIVGPESVMEEGTAQMAAVIGYDDGGQMTVPAAEVAWSLDSEYATIDSAGVVHAGTVTANQVVTVSATFDGKTVLRELTVANTPEANAWQVTGPSTVAEQKTAQLSAIIGYNNGTQVTVPADQVVWSLTSEYATIDAMGVVHAGAVPTDQVVVVSGTFGGHTVDYQLTITNSAEAANEALTFRGVGDFNGDGTDDVLWSEDLTGRLFVWHIQNGVRSDARYLGQAALNDWHVIGVGDFDGDSRADVVWTNDSAHIVGVWLTRDNHVDYEGRVNADIRDWRAIGIGDFDGNGTRDVVLRHTSGIVMGWCLQADDTVLTKFLGMTDATWQNHESFGDLNADGRDDVILENRDMNIVGAWLIQPGETPALYSQVGAADLNVWELSVVGNYSGDGADDLILVNPSQGEAKVWDIAGGAMVKDNALGDSYDPAEFQVVGAGDHDGDDWSDVLWINRHTSVVGTWLVRNMTPRWAQMSADVGLLRGTVQGSGNVAAGFDRDLATTWNCTQGLSETGPAGSMDLGLPRAITAVRYAPGEPYGMNGGRFEVASRSDFSDAQLLFTVEGSEPGEMVTRSVEPGGLWRYIRFAGATGGAYSVAELEFWGR